MQEPTLDKSSYRGKVQKDTVGGLLYKTHFMPLKPIHNQKKKRIVAFDTEDNGTGAPGNFLLCCFYDGSETHSFTEREDARNFVLKSYSQDAPLIFAHNLAYDLGNIDYPEGSVNLIPLRGRLIGGEYKYGRRKRLRFMDTGNFFMNASIAQLGKMLAYKEEGKREPKVPFMMKMEKTGCPGDDECVAAGYDEGGMCRHCKMFSVRAVSGKQPPIAPKIMDNMIEYCAQDSRICWQVANMIQTLCLNHNTRFRSFTTAAMAMTIFRTSYMDRPWKMRQQEINDFERMSYYGGRTEVFNYSHHNRILYEDIQSSYPRAMKEEVYPIPWEFTRISNPHWEQVKRHEGISLVTINIPKMHIPPLPYRRPKDGKLLFPYGTWTGTYTHPELKMAERYGARIIKVHDSIVYSQTFRPFVGFVTFFYDKKEKSPKGSIERDFNKLILNGLSGKFGEKRNLTVRGHIDTIDVCNCADKSQYDKSNMCLACHKIQIGGSEIFISEEGWVSLTGGRLPDPKHTFPVIIAYVCSYARMKLYEDRLKEGEAIYCDTDSYVGLRPIDIAVGKELGEWDRKDKINFRAIAPKFYSMYDTDGTHSDIKLKGVAKRHRVVYGCRKCSKEYLHPETCCGKQLDDSDKLYIFSRPTKLAESVRRGMKVNMWGEIKKRVSLHDDKRIKHNDGTSEPLLIDEEYRSWTFENFLGRNLTPTLFEEEDINTEQH